MFSLAGNVGDSESMAEPEPVESKLFPLNNSFKEEAKSDNFIVNTVLNAIRELANRLGRMEQLRDCPICGDTVTGESGFPLKLTEKYLQHST